MPNKNQLKETAEDLVWRFRDRKFITKLPTKTPSYFLKLPYPSENIYIDIYIRAGITLEKEETNGYGHLLEHYLSELLYQAYGNDFESNGRINYEEMNLYVKTNAKNFIKDVENFFRIVFNPTFDNEKILTYEKRAIINEINNNRHQLDQKIIDEKRRQRFNESDGYSRSFSDQTDSTQKITLEQIAGYYQKIFNRNNCFVLISASLLPPALRQRTIKTLERYALPDGERLDYPMVSFAPQKIITSPDKLVTGTYLSISFPAYSFMDKEDDFIAASLLAKLITGRSEYGIGKEAREKGFYGLTYRLSRFHYSGYLSLNTYVPTEEIEIFLELLATKIRALKENLINEKELKRYRRVNFNQDKHCWRSNGCRMEWISSDLMHYDHIETYEKVKESYRKLVPEKIREVAQYIFNPKLTHMILYGETPSGIDKLWDHFSI